MHLLSRKSFRRFVEHEIDSELAMPVRGAALQLVARESSTTAATPGARPTAEQPDATPSAAKNQTSSLVVTAGDLNQLREKISKQEEEIKHLQQSVEEQRLLLEQALKNSGSPTALVPVVNVAYPI
jgi:predicted RNase H-like nuclease (RuvC/YqgF family)